MTHLSNSLGVYALLLTVASGLAGCSSGGGSGSAVLGGGTTPDVIGSTTLNSLSGQVRSTGGLGLSGVILSVGGAAAVTDASGEFMLVGLDVPPGGEITVQVDGRSAGLPGQFPMLDYLAHVAPDGNHGVLSRVLTLPDLGLPSNALQSVATDATGMTLDPIAVTGPRPDLSLSAPAGTSIVRFGAAGQAGITNLALVAVGLDEAPTSFPFGSDRGPASFVFVEPADAEFDPPGVQEGLDLVLPNPRNLPVGTPVEIYHHDGEGFGVFAGGYLSTEGWNVDPVTTGSVGVVVDTGGGTSEIRAPGVVARGGFYAASFRIDTTCATIVEGRVVNAASMEGIPGALARFENGVSAVTDRNGSFVHLYLANYDLGDSLSTPAVCTPGTLEYEILLPPQLGSQVLGPFSAMNGEGQLGDILVDLPELGSLSGLVRGQPLSQNEEVQIVNATGQSWSAPVSFNGGFFLHGLPVGDYTAALRFLGRAEPVEADFSIQPGRVSESSLQYLTGSGSRTIAVQVFQQNRNRLEDPKDVLGATVQLRGSDATSSQGLIGLSNTEGRVLFENVEGPFTITAQADFVFSEAGGIRRSASTLFAAEAAGGTAGILLPPLERPLISATDGGYGQLTGQVLGLPSTGTYWLQVRGSQDGSVAFEGFDVPDVDGFFSVDVPAGHELDATLYSVEVNPLQLRGTLHVSNLGSVSAQQVRNINIDWNDDARIDWDRPVEFSISGLEPANLGAFFSAELRNAEGDVVFDLQLGILSEDIPPQTWNLPDITALASADMELWVRVETPTDQFTDPRQESTLQILTNSSEVEIAMEQRPMLTQTSWYVSLPGADSAPPRMAWSPGADPIGTSGYDFFTLAGGPYLEGRIRWFEWDFILPPDTTSFFLPGTPRPMFVKTETIQPQITRLRYEGIEFSPEAYFSADLPTALSNLRAEHTKRIALRDPGFILTNP